jgi:hypothetical protein
MRKPYCFVLPILALIFSGCEFVDAGFNSQRVRGSGKMSRENRNVRGFREVKFTSVGEVTLEQGATESLEIEAEDNLLPYIRTEVEGGRLRIGTERGVSLSPTITIRYRLTVKEIEGIELSGSGKIVTSPLTCSEMKLNLPGSGEIRIGGLSARVLEASISGSGDIEVPGKAGRVTVEISGSGEYNGGGLESETADISISGSGDATVWVRDRLSASISGSGDVDYYGEPSVTRHVSGSGGVRSRGARR